MRPSCVVKGDEYTTYTDPLSSKTIYCLEICKVRATSDQGVIHVGCIGSFLSPIIFELTNTACLVPNLDRLGSQTFDHHVPSQRIVRAFGQFCCLGDNFTREVDHDKMLETAATVAEPVRGSAMVSI